ncbi:transposase [Streptomyces barkulensis]|uniref:transposase n=1 Tax=Streptomyces barkulensis TaxID=1257026 RepID=UPI0013044423|nr:transposase [Streptomyces barkulensis]
MIVYEPGRPDRFPTAAACANYCGTAPMETADADKARHRLSRAGDRQFNSVLHAIAVIQPRLPGNLGRPTTAGRSPEAGRQGGRAVPQAPPDRSRSARRDR